MQKSLEATNLMRRWEGTDSNCGIVSESATPYPVKVAFGMSQRGLLFSVLECCTLYLVRIPVISLKPQLQQSLLLFNAT